MYNPDFKTVEELSHVRTQLSEFSAIFKSDYDPDDELDSQLNMMLDLIIEGVESVYEEMKRRL